MSKSTIVLLGILAAGVLLSGEFPHSAQAISSNIVAAPVLKWQRGGCFSTYCRTGWYASPAVADLDNDRQPEVIWGDRNIVALNGTDGSLKWQADNSQRVWPGIAVADLTGDGDLEIIAGRNGDQLTVYNHLGGIEWSASPFGDGEVRTLAVEDLELDGHLEIIVGRGSGGKTKQVKVFEANGSVRRGWPARHDGEPGNGWGMYNENVTIADLDNDGFKEIIAPTDTHFITALDRNGDQLPVSPVYAPRTVWSEVGIFVDHNVDLRGYANCGEEHRPNFANSAPAIADVNSDGTLEIIAIGDVYDCSIGDNIEGDLYYTPWIFNLDRTRWRGSGFDWTEVPPDSGQGGRPLTEDRDVIRRSVTNAVVADLDGDGFKEILFPAYDGKMHAYWLDKTEHANWPYQVPGSGIRFAGEPIVVDLDNDNRAEIIFTSWPEIVDNRVGQLHILNYRGDALYTLDLPAPFGGDWNGGLGAPTIANIDGDPDMELVIGTAYSGVVAYDLPNSADAHILWGTGRGSYKRTGVSPSDTANNTFLLNINPSTHTTAPREVSSYVITVQAGDNFNGTVTLNAVNPSPSNLTLNLSPLTLTLSGQGIGQATLTLTDHTSALLPGAWHNIPVTATSNGTTRIASVNLLVGGAKTYLPAILK